MWGPQNRPQKSQRTKPGDVTMGFALLFSSSAEIAVSPRMVVEESGRVEP
jgi:hypothetical protein